MTESQPIDPQQGFLEEDMYECRDRIQNALSVIFDDLHLAIIADQDIIPGAVERFQDLTESIVRQLEEFRASGLSW